MKSNKSYFVFFLLFPAFLIAQQNKQLFFNKDWQITAIEDQIYYVCDCYVNNQNQFIGKFSCYTKSQNVLVKEYHFVNNLMHGPVREYYENAQLKLEATYDMGEAVGEWKEYNQNGDLELHRTFDEQSKVVRDYYQNLTPYEKELMKYNIQERPPIYTSDCIRLKIDQQRYDCSEEALAAYFANVPIAEKLKTDPQYAGKTFVCEIAYTINKKGIVYDAEILQSTGDDFLDLLATSHALNMVPFEAAVKNGVAIEYTKNAKLTFVFN